MNYAEKNWDEFEEIDWDSPVMEIGKLRGPITVDSESWNRLLECVEKLNIKNGDIILIRQDGTFDFDAVEVMHEGLKELGLENVGLIFIDDDTQVSALDEDEMARHGWFRKKETRGYEFL